MEKWVISHQRIASKFNTPTKGLRVVMNKINWIRFVIIILIANLNNSFYFQSYAAQCTCIVQNRQIWIEKPVKKLVTVNRTLLYTRSLDSRYRFSISFHRNNPILKCLVCMHGTNNQFVRGIGVSCQKFHTSAFLCTEWKWL